MKTERIKKIFWFLKTCKLKSQLMRDILHENGDPFIFVATLWWDHYFLADFFSAEGAFLANIWLIVFKITFFHYNLRFINTPQVNLYL